MEKEENYLGAFPGAFPGLDNTLENHHHQQQNLMKNQITETSGDHHGNQMVDYMVNNPQQQLPISSSGFCGSNSLDKLSFADVMQFADFGPKLALNQSRISSDDDESGIDPVYFLKFPVLNEKLLQDGDQQQSLAVPQQNVGDNQGGSGNIEARSSENTAVQIRFQGDNNPEKSPGIEAKTKRKRPRTTKTSEEVESQRMTHIAVERNRRKQMNEHLRLLRSLMPGSYVQRGDQASIIGGAIEFVRELEQLLQCLESQKRRRLYGDDPRPVGDSSAAMQHPQPQSQSQSQPQPPFFASPMALPNDQIPCYETGLQEETAESKSCLADIEVKLLGFDAMIKILCRRRHGQLVKILSALEDMQLNILHINITTIEQTVLYSLNVKVGGEARYTAEDIANTVQQIFSFIHTNSNV